ncbi:MAG: hypothetical protein GF331_18970 [Chitinivibrionales bacterium]|nr:hypothetical protein [Chitinivibrionales bacterium]
MKAAIPVLALLLAALPLTVTISCSSDGPVAGGTETGNPELGIAVSMLFDALSDSAQWNARTYVPGGMDRLDSASIVSGAAYSHPDGVLAKRWIEQSDTVVGSLRYVTTTIYIDDTLPKVDTTVLYDTTHVQDTLTETYVVYDTTIAVEDGDTTSIVRQRFQTDSVFVADTVYSADTTYTSDTLFIVDTIVVHDTIPADSTPSTTAPDTAWLPSSGDWRYSSGELVTADIDSIGVEYTRDSGVSYVIVRTSDSVAPSYIAVNPANYRIDQTEATVLITKDLAAAGGAVVTQEYADIDGDGSLFGTGDQAIRLVHTYSLPPESLYAIVEVGNGPDGSFATAADNALFGLLRLNWTEKRADSLVYVSPPSYVPGDPLHLKRIERYADSSLSRLTSTYELQRGTSTAANDDQLTAWSGLATYGFGSDTAETVLIELTFPDPIARGAMPTQAVARIEARLQNHSFGQMDGAVVDFSDRTLIGVYHKDGASYDVIVSYTCQ